MNCSTIDSKINIIRTKLKYINIRLLSDYRLDKLLYTKGRTLSQNWFDLRYVIKNLIKKIFFRYYLLDCNIKGNKIILFNYLQDRKDYIDSWSCFKSFLLEYDEITFNMFQHLLLYRFNSLFTIIMNIVFFFVFFKKLKVIENLNDRLYLSTELVELKNFDNIITHLINDKHKLCVVFFDGWPITNLLIQKFNQNNKKTLTLMHGQPVFRGDNDLFNQTILFNFTANYIALPGEFSKKQFLLAGVESNRLKILGTFRKIRLFKTIKSNIFTVFLNSPTFDFGLTNNLILLNLSEHIAEKLGFTYVIKLHPSDDSINYKDIKINFGHFLSFESSIEQAIESSEFSILNASGVYLDILSFNCKAFAFIPNGFVFPLIESNLDCFLNQNDFFNKLKLWYNLSEFDKKNYLNSLIKYYLDPEDAKNRYREFINSLIDN